MAKKRAKTFDEKQFDKLLKHVTENSPMPVRDRLIVALSFKAGLRVGEIAKIKIAAMLTTTGTIAKDINIFSDVAKGRRERTVPMNGLVKECLQAFRKAYPSADVVAISAQPWRWKLERGEAIPAHAAHKAMSPTALRAYYNRLIQSGGFEGASTHSGRRTFGTTLARSANHHHCSLRDVQRLMGHASIETTEQYIEVSDDARSLVGAL